jgi:hypothetical protein
LLAQVAVQRATTVAAALVAIGLLLPANPLVAVHRLSLH